MSTIYAVLTGGGVSIVTGLATGLGVARYGDRRAAMARNEQRRLDLYVQMIAMTERFGPVVQDQLTMAPLPDVDMASVGAAAYLFATNKVHAAYNHWCFVVNWYRGNQAALEDASGEEQGRLIGEIAGVIKPTERRRRKSLMDQISYELGYEPEPEPPRRPRPDILDRLDREHAGRRPGSRQGILDLLNRRREGQG